MSLFTVPFRGHFPYCRSQCHVMCGDQLMCCRSFLWTGVRCMIEKHCWIDFRNWIGACSFNCIFIVFNILLLLLLILLFYFLFYFYIYEVFGVINVITIFIIIITTINTAIMVIIIIIIIINNWPIWRHPRLTANSISRTSAHIYQLNYRSLWDRFPIIGRSAVTYLSMVVVSGTWHEKENHFIFYLCSSHPSNSSSTAVVFTQAWNVRNESTVDNWELSTKAAAS